MNEYELGKEMSELQHRLSRVEQILNSLMDAPQSDVKDDQPKR